MKKLIAMMMLFACVASGATNPVWYTGSDLVVYGNTNTTTNALGVLTNNISTAVNFNGTVTGQDGSLSNSFTTLRQLETALGGLSVLYASTNTTLGVTNDTNGTLYYDARTFLPTHTQAVIVATCSNGNYLASWASNTNILKQIRPGIAVITGRMRLSNVTPPKWAWVKPELYAYRADKTEPELYETGSSNYLNSTAWQDTMNYIDIPTGCVFAAGDRGLLKWKSINQSGNPQWEFQCGTGLVIAVRLPTAGEVTGGSTGWTPADTNYSRDAQFLTNIQSTAIVTNSSYIDGMWCEYYGTNQVFWTSTNGYGSGYCASKYFFNNTWKTSTIPAAILGAGPSATNTIVYIYQKFTSCPTFDPYFDTNVPIYVSQYAQWCNSTTNTDRCIDAILCTNNYSILPVFVRLQNGGYSIPFITLLSSGNPNQSWQSPTIQLSSFFPINAFCASLSMYCGDADGGSAGAVSPSETVPSTNAFFTASLSFYSTVAGQYLLNGDIPLGKSRNISWCGYDNDDNVFAIYVMGWRLTR